MGVGPEALQVDAGVDDGDPVGVGVVVPEQFVRFFLGVRYLPVGGPYDLCLADHASRGLGGCRPRRGRRS
jgi:hypothetical protein